MSNHVSKYSTPHIDRKMVGLLSDIRHNLPADQRQKIQASSPRIGDIIIELHRSSENINVKRLTSDFLRRAGSQWEAHIQQTSN